MKNIWSIMFLLAISLFCSAQHIELYDFNSGGKETQINSNYVSYSIGGTFVTSLQNQDRILTQGFQQPLTFGLVTGMPYYYSNEKIEIHAFPNPALNEVYILLKNLKEVVNAYIDIKDISGKSIAMPYVQYELRNQQAVRLDLTNLEQGYYIVNIISEDNYERIGFFKLIKIK